MLGALCMQSQNTAPDSRLSKYREHHNTRTPTDGTAEGKHESVLVHVSKELAHEVPGITAGLAGDSHTKRENKICNCLQKGD